MKNKILLTVAAFAVGTQLMAQGISYVTLSSGTLDVGQNKDNSFYRLAYGVNNYFFDDYMLFGVELGAAYDPELHKNQLVNNKDAYEIDAEFKLGGHIDPINLDLYGLVGSTMMFYNETEFSNSGFEDVTQVSYALTTGVGAQWYYDESLTLNASYKTGNMKNPDTLAEFDYSRLTFGVGICW